MIIGSLNADWNLVIYLLTSFVIGMGSMLIYLKSKDRMSKLKPKPDQSIAEAIVSEYTRRLQSYDKVIGELRAKIDGLELVLTQRSDTGYFNTADASNITHSSDKFSKISQSGNDPLLEPHKSQVVKQAKSQIPEHESLQSKRGVITSNITPKDVIRDNHDVNYPNRLSTSDQILNLLGENPRTSREIQRELGKTREHTSRLMRKLYESNLVARDDNSKPFKYHITEAGRRELMLYNAVAQTKANIRNPENFTQ